MTLCPNCRTIQKAGTACSICKCPVHPQDAMLAARVAAVVGRRIV
jgi:hypothetical protein